MKQLWIGALALLTFCSAAAASTADRFNPTQPAKATSMQTFGITSMPYGYYDYCMRNRERCARGPGGSKIELTRPTWSDIVRVNAEVNAIKALTDLEIYGVEEFWDYPTEAADCEDYALLKRRRLNEMGYPLGALLLTTARDANGGGHAVLTVVTTLGDFILDNLEQKVLLWSEARIYFLKRQSQRDLNQWVSLIDEDQFLISSGNVQAPATAATSVNR
jgi:predicted transglutaminase-like cysteine proteinase